MIATAPSAEPVAPSELGRGPLARAALIRAGVQVFGENSLASATTREIAQLAGQNISAIAYYFGNKEGLYFAVAQHRSERTRCVLAFVWAADRRKPVHPPRNADRDQHRGQGANAPHQGF